MRIGRRWVLASIAALAAAVLLRPMSSRADSLPRPTGEVVLTIDGAIAETNDASKAVFDRAMLQALPMRQIVTETPWTKGLHTFTGVPLEVLLARVGAHGKMLTAAALNDYSAELPADDGERNGALVAYLYDGQPMLASDRGPLWIVYPFSERRALKTESFYIRAVWNLEALTVH